MNNKLVSIVLPSFNGSGFLRTSIESVIGQTFPSWELVLVDDCSQDSTWDIMQEYHHNNPEKIRCYQHNKNRKLPSALNTGFRKAKGDYLTWTSDDNIYKPEALEKMVIYLEDNKNIGLVYSDYSLIDSDGSVIDDIEVQDPTLLWKTSVVRYCFLYRREVFERVGLYSKKMRLVEDHDYWLRVYKYYTLMPMHDNLYYYRVHAGSLSNNNQAKVKKLKEKLIVQYLHLFDIENDQFTEIFKKLILSSISRKNYLQA